jgi:hypothetical protein
VARSSDIRYLFPVRIAIHPQLITMCYEDGGFYSTAVTVRTLCYRQDLIYPTDIFKRGPGRAVGQQGSRAAGRRAQVGGHCPGPTGRGRVCDSRTAG